MPYGLKASTSSKPRVHLALQASDRDLIAQLADERGLSLSAYVRLLIREHVSDVTGTGEC